ncbi:hypothetical protein Anapl_12240 [Anas platyrhynchos]|uniref:Uncharacterized protein n=1 Tax=Anas platyrhynchos TaxID=8839 RepID=R0JWP9_ANAPL|nr:hypothetical protein Anapl_12240 [Anas platyrhynchos]
MTERQWLMRLAEPSAATHLYKDWRHDPVFIHGQAMEQKAYSLKDRKEAEKTLQQVSVPSELEKAQLCDGWAYRKQHLLLFTIRQHCFTNIQKADELSPYIIICVLGLPPHHLGGHLLESAGEKSELERNEAVLGSSVPVVAASLANLPPCAQWLQGQNRSVQIMTAVPQPSAVMV